MTLEEAITIMKNEMPSCGDKLTFTSEELYEAYQLAIDALRKQRSKRPLEKDRVIEGLYGFCANCNQLVSEEVNYCPHCGQAIDWSEHDD